MTLRDLNYSYYTTHTSLDSLAGLANDGSTCSTHPALSMEYDLPKYPTVVKELAVERHTVSCSFLCGTHRPSTNNYL